ncbi:MAG: ZIP family metal transporter [Phycisphaeraceae bacterium]|nr:ZIP family metal transporter [Phycisphaeraceae bacterium]
MISYPLLAGYCVLIVLASIGGGLVPLIVNMTHRRMQLAMSLIGGFMMGVALLHLAPHAMQSAGVVRGSHWLLLGMLVMFLLERFFHFHHHEVAESETDPDAGHDEACAHDEHQHVHVHEQRMTWSGAAVGLVLHCLIAGAALAASMAAGHEARWAGMTVFLAIILHKPFDSLTLLTLLTAAGWSKLSRHLVNLLFSLVVPAGAGLFLLGIAGADLENNPIVGCAVAFAAGVFLCIALSDLLPEVQFHAHDKFKLTTALLLGVALAWTVSAFEMHGHEHGHEDEHHHGEQVESAK